MNWSNVRLILFREIRDQLRDRRTLFMIFVLPVLLYPLMGTGFFQMTQFLKATPSRVLIVGKSHLPQSPPLIDGTAEKPQFAEGLFGKQEDKSPKLLELSFAPQEIEQTATSLEALEAHAKREVLAGQYDAAIVIPPDFASGLAAFRARLTAAAPVEVQPSAEANAFPVSSPKLVYNTAKESWTTAYVRVNDVMRRWADEIGKENLQLRGIPREAARPFELLTRDVAEVSGHRGAALWSKVLPFLLLVWALTGAFYPAIDLCAGEKERGTLETLLSSPAERSEIVWGKLLTVMLFSITTAILNLISMGMTGQLVLSQLPHFGPPPPLAPLWLALALIPVSALFSALCLALAAFAKSSKEGQYYLMPLMVVTLPLVVLPMFPGFDLNLGNSLIPVTGVMLVLRSLLEGDYYQAMIHAPIVAAVTLIGCLLAIRWAIDQFNSENVLFRESERLELGLWLRHLLRDREDTPTVAQALFCGVVILLVQFFMNVVLSGHAQEMPFEVVAVVSQLAVIATPALLMTVMLTRSPRETLLLRLPTQWRWTLPAAVLLAIALHPAANVLQTAVMKLYPISDTVAQQLNGVFDKLSNFWLLVVVVAVVPAICEELAFRGFILSGLRHLGHKRRAIIISSILFGVAHSIFQQSLIACLMGVIIGYLAVQTGSLLPGVLFHLVHNTLGVLNTSTARRFAESTPWASDLVDACRPLAPYVVQDLGDDGSLYRWPVVAIGGVIAVAILLALRQLPCSQTVEEQLQEAIARQDGQSLLRQEIAG